MQIGQGSLSFVPYRLTVGHKIHKTLIGYAKKIEKIIFKNTISSQIE